MSFNGLPVNNKQKELTTKASLNLLTFPFHLSRGLWMNNFQLINYSISEPSNSQFWLIFFPLNWKKKEKKKTLSPLQIN